MVIILYELLKQTQPLAFISTATIHNELYVFISYDHTFLTHVLNKIRKSQNQVLLCPQGGTKISRNQMFLAKASSFQT